MQKPQVMRIKKTIVLAVEEDLSVDLTFHNISASILAKWAQKMVSLHRELERGNPESKPKNHSLFFSA
jgi:hypothetical protein